MRRERGASSEGREEKEKDVRRVGRGFWLSCGSERERERGTDGGKREEEHRQGGEAREHIVPGRERIFSSMMRPSHRFTSGSARALLRFILFTLFSCCLFLYISLHLFRCPSYPGRAALSPFPPDDRTWGRCFLPIHSVHYYAQPADESLVWKTATRPILPARQWPAFSSRV